MSHWDDDDQPELRVDRFWAVTHPRRRRYHRRYREDAPKLRALVAIHCGILQDLIHIGEALEWLIDETGEPLGDYIHTAWSDLPSGIYIWEGEVNSDGYTDYYGEYECEHWLEGEFRPATKEEWEAHVNGEYPWDPSLWLLSALEVEPEKPEKVEATTPLFMESDILDDDLEPMF